MSGEPLVTVLLSTYNDLRFLPQAMPSVLGQTFGDFEMLVVDDGSTDGTGEYLRAICNEDRRVRVIRNEQNRGLTRSLNHGLEAARGRLVARMDADDVCTPDRLARQVEFLQRHPDVGIVGSSRILIDEDGKVLGHARAVPDDLDIRWKCLLGNPFAHPTVMLRRDVLVGRGLRYDESYTTAQDYELWTRLLRHMRGANLQEPLLQYRLREGVTRTRKADQLRNHDRIALAAIRMLLPGFPITLQDVRELRGRFGGYSVREPEWHRFDARWTARYLALLDSFCAKYRREPGIEAFRRKQEAAMLAAA